MNTIQVILVVIVYTGMLFIIGQLVYILIDLIKDDAKHNDFTMTPIAIMCIGTCIIAIVIIGLLPIIH